MTVDQNNVSTKDIEQRRRSRNLAIGLSLAAFVVLIFVITIVRLGPGVLDRPM